MIEYETTCPNCGEDVGLTMAIKMPNDLFDELTQCSHCGIALVVTAVVKWETRIP